MTDIHLGFCTTKLDAVALENSGQFNILNSADLTPLTFAVFGNRESLPKKYNLFINSRDGILVLVHDDVLITDKNWREKVRAGLETYDVVGLAGGSEPVIKNPCLWHLMCPRQTWRGEVRHLSPEGTVFNTKFGPQGRVLILDGLFLAFRPKVLIDAGVQFDESNPCIAHFYDIDFSLTCNKKKLKIGTVNVEVVHSSPGLKEFTPEWLAGEKWFLDKVKRGEY